MVYHDLYPGIDLQYGGHAGLLKGTYTLAAGVDPSIIRWHYVGADSVNLDSSTGNLTITAPDSVALTEQTPIAWQTRANGTQLPVTVGYRVNADGSVQFAPADYDRALPLVVDPGLVYSTYLGGNSNDVGYGIAVDGNGNAYVTGFTYSVNFPTTGGTFQTAFRDGDAFVSKLNASGSALVYSTYLGGSGTDLGYGIAVDGSGNVYVTGQTSSSNFPITSGAFQSVYGGTSAGDAFVSKLNATGSGLVYSTFLGGSGDDAGFGIVVDNSNNVYVTGDTSSANFPTTSGALQITLRGSQNAFVSKLNANGSALVYSTFLGSSNWDQANGIAVNSSGNAYVTGYTSDASFPTTLGAYQTIFAGGSYDAFVSELDVSGEALVYSTFLGGTNVDVGNGVAVDSSGNAYVTGQTYSADFPTTPGAFQSSGYAGVFVSKLNPSLNGTASLVYSTYISSSANGRGNGIAVDSSGNAYVTGQTYSADFPTTPDAFQITSGGGSDAFVSKLNASGSALIYSTYLGASAGDLADGIAVDSSGNAYVTGPTGSANFPTTSGAFQTTYQGGSEDAFISRVIC